MSIAAFRFAKLPDGFVEETTRLLHGRVRAAAYLVFFVHLFFLPLDFVRYPEFAATAAAVRSAVCIVLLVVAATVAKLRDLTALRWITMAVVGLSVLPFVVVIRHAHGPEDPRYLEQLVPITYAIVASSLFFPLGGRAAVAIGGTPVVLHTLATVDFPPLANLPLLLLSLAALGVASVGSEGALRARVGDYEGRLAKDALLRARADVAAMLSHDLKNPLAAILGAVDFQRDDGLDDAAGIANTLDRIEAAARRALLLVTNFLEASRVGDGRLAPRRRPVDLRMTIERLVAEQGILGSVKEVRLEAAIEGERLPIEVDEGQIDRVLANLVQNSIQHSPIGGRVIVSARSCEGGIEVTVEDEGDGIPPEALPRIFDRYSTAASRLDSTGLGLFVVKSLVAAHGGTITAENREPGPGARFRVVLPEGTPLSPRLGA